MAFAAKMPDGKLPMMEDKGSSPSIFIKPGKKDMGRKGGKKSGRAGGRGK